jgi:hypothetical protein
MGYESLVKQNPLRVLKLTGSRKMGLIMARTGVGKTALLVQIALDSILRGNRVVHISIGETLDKTKLWYDDMLQVILQECSVTKPHELIDMVRQHRMIMTFKAGTFDRARLEERLGDLIEQNIFKPDCVVIDGERVSPSGVPAPCHELDGLFETVILLKPEQDHILLEILRKDGQKDEGGSHLGLDPATMMVRQED